MSISPIVHTEVVSYIPDTGIIGYFLLGQDEQGRWYWGEATGDDAAVLVSGCFHGPCCHKGEAIIAGEDWVAETVLT